MDIQGRDVSTIGTSYSPLLLHAATSILRPAEKIHINFVPCNRMGDLPGLAQTCPNLCLGLPRQAWGLPGVV